MTDPAPDPHPSAADPSADPATGPTASAGAFRVLAFSGSLRAASSNTGLIRLAMRLLDERHPGVATVEVVDWLDQIPYYNEDLELEPPATVRRWRDTVTASDAMLIGLPEYNYGPSAVAKNAIDWASRPFGASSLRGKVIALLTSAGKGGGVNVQQAISPILGFFGNTMIERPAVTIAMGPTRIAADGTTDDEEILRLVAEKVDNLVAALRER